MVDDLKSMSDESLVRLVSANNTDSCFSPEVALEHLLNRHWDWIMRYCVARLRDEQIAKDCLQEIMIAISKNITSFKKKSKFSTWAYTIARRTVSRHLTAKNKREAKFLTLDSHNLDRREREANQLNDLIIAEQDHYLLSCINKLPAKQSEAMLLYYYNDLNVEQAAQRMSCSISTLKTHLRRGRGKLKISLKDSVNFR